MFANVSMRSTGECEITVDVPAVDTGFTVIGAME